MEIRPYEPRDADGLWDCKRGFELGLGSGTGGEEKEAKYEGKLDDQYREAWFDWVDRCVDADPRCVTVAVDDTSDDDAGGEVVGYVFVLPERHRFIWDAAVLNELYVAPDHRGTGVADDLMAAAVNFARDQDLPLDRLVLDVDRENDRAKAFYDRYGFEHWGEMVAREL
ncbi:MULTISPECIES: GNAT family N-acetyltransferase [Halolamina]|uniref:Acetyltransferase (GNAT) family protein n=1 Tax=Halolamina pelagica TaxID=699431 RepID=A0A1I5QP59_9EURY|nr:MULTISPECIES: N-acetyltransferase [Halolamina]NHX35472.1 GNAT family N-acetyltransferase [Halolamina sp. R1-12]SFP47890.1 Acetyltransferase (GNAT) family protein [Halolamina pelagica]